MKNILFIEIQSALEGYEIRGSAPPAVITNVNSIEAADSESLVWIKSTRPDMREQVLRCKARLIICDKGLDVQDFESTDKCFLAVDNPKLEFMRLVNKFFSANPEWGTDPTAIIHPDAKIHKKTYIGPFTYVGNATIGEGTFLHGHNHIYDNVVIGRNVVIHAQTVVGSDGFGFVWNEENVAEKFLHLGETVIEDNVELFPFVNVDRGTMSETRIMAGVKVDHFCHIGHNTVIGKNSIITAGAVLCGGSRVGSNSWLGVNSVIKEKIEVGAGCMVGIGSVVTKDVPDGETWMGSPARPREEFIRLQEEMKKHIKKP